MGIYYGDLSISYNNGGIDTKDATITSKDVLYNKVAYGAEGRIVGSSPFKYTDGEPTGGVLPTIGEWISVCYGNGMFVAVTNEDIGTYAYSIDGMHWVQNTMPVALKQLSVCYGNGMFVAVPSTASDIAVCSTDGINWIQSILPASISWKSVCYGNGMFVAVGGRSNVAAYSTDGITWT